MTAVNARPHQSGNSNSRQVVTPFAQKDTRHARARVGESEGRSPSDKNIVPHALATAAPSSHARLGRAPRADSQRAASAAAWPRHGPASVSLLRRVAAPQHHRPDDAYRPRWKDCLVVYQSRCAASSATAAGSRTATFCSRGSSARAKSRPTRRSSGTTTGRRAPRFTPRWPVDRDRVLIMQNGDPADADDHQQAQRDGPRPRSTCRRGTRKVCTASSGTSA